MENVFCRHLRFNFDINLDFLNSIKKSYSNTSQRAQFKIPLSEVDQNLSKLLDSVGIHVTYAEIFYTPPYSSIEIHTDTITSDNTNRLSPSGVKLNWVFDSNNSKMIWWEPRDPIKDVVWRTTALGNRYMSYNKEDCNKLWEEQIASAGLVNVGIPHSVENYDSVGRWAMTHFLKFKKDEVAVSWNEAEEIFKKYL